MFSSYRKLSDEFRNYSQLLQSNPGNPDILKKLCKLSSQMGNHEIAEKLSGFLVKKFPENAAYHHSFGQTLYNNKKWSKALEQFKTADDLHPSSPEILTSLAKIYEKLGQYKDALTEISKLEKIVKPTLSSGIMIARQFEKLNLNEKAHHKLIELDSAYPGNFEVKNAMGQFFLKTRELSEAINWFNSAISVSPDHAYSYWNFAIANLVEGNFNDGWKWYEKRRKIPGKKLPPIIDKLQQPELTQVEIIQNKSILIISEEGFGDVIQFSRYASLLKSAGANNVYLHCRKPIKELMNCADNIDGAYDKLEQLPSFDNWILLLSLPHLFKTNFNNLPHNTPYINPDERSFQLKNNPQTKLNVGVVWQTETEAPGDRFRSCPPELFSNLFNINNVQFYSLQFSDQKEQISGISNVTNCAPMINSFMDTASIIKKMDLVITIDSAVAHLAGAMHKPVWMLTPHRVYDWRWFDAFQDSSPWYPSMRIFRQTVDGDWETILNEVKIELTDLV